MGPGPPGWEIGCGVDNATRKKTACRKPELWPQKGLMKRKELMQGTGRSSQGIEEYGGGPLWRQVVVPVKKKKKNRFDVIRDKH